MRTSAFITAAFAATAFSTPLRKRDLDVETVTDITYVTNMVTETAAAATSTVTPPAVVYHYPHSHKHHSSHSTAVAASSAAPVESSAPASSSEAPVETTSVYVAPTTSEAAPTTAAATTTAALSTYQAPAPTTSTQATSAAAAATAPASFAYYDATKYTGDVIGHHNVHRANHSASDIAWNQTLASIAKDIANTCVYKHNTTAGGGGYGQNIAAGLDPSTVSAVISDLFYDGEVNNYNGLYGQANPDMSNFENWGHFSQIVWKGTTQVGCYTSNCTVTPQNPQGLQNTGGGNIPPYFTVCNYGAPGNYAGEYGTNVGSPLGHATVNGDDVVSS